MKRTWPCILGVALLGAVMLFASLTGARRQRELEDRVDRLIRSKGIMRTRLEAVRDVCRDAIELGVQR